MRTKLIERTPAAYGYPLLIKHLLYTPLQRAPEQEIVYRELKRYDYRAFRFRRSRFSTPSITPSSRQIFRGPRRHLEVGGTGSRAVCRSD